MRRVYFIYWVKRVLRPVFVKSTFLLVCLGWITAFVSVRQIVLNLLSVSDLSAMIRFTVDALASTETRVQFLAFLSAALFIWLARDVVRGLFTARPLRV